MDNRNKSQPLEIYDMSVNNPSAQSFLEKSAFLKFLIQQIRLLHDESGNVKENVSKYNNFASQIDRVRREMLDEKNYINEHMVNFKSLLEEVNQRKRAITQSIMQLTREKSLGTINQDDYHRKKYEMEMKRKSLGNQTLILNKNISIYNNLLSLPIASDTFQKIEEEYEVPEEAVKTEEGLDDNELLLDASAEGITFMGVLNTDDIEQALSKKKTTVASVFAETDSADEVEPKQEFRLNIITETGKQYYYSLSSSHVVRIGRSTDTDIQIPSPAVSRVHAEIRFENNDYYVVDLESSNGTFVNDKMVIRRKLEINDTISIGGTRMILLT